MKSCNGVFIGLLLSVSVSAESLIEGRVRLDSGEPVADAQVRLFDLSDLRRGAIARAMTDGTGYFSLPLAALTGQALPARFELGPNYPNPFNPSTNIPYQLAASSEVRLEVFNLLGQRLATLVDGERPAGFHTATWHAVDRVGRAVGAGVYIYRMTVGVESQTGRMVLIDGQAGLSAGGVASVMPGASGIGGSAGEGAHVYGLIVSGRGLVPYVDSSFRVEGGMAPVELVVLSGHSGGKAADDDCAFCDLFDALNDEEEGPGPSGKAQAALEAPPVPTNLRFEAVTDSSCRVRWDVAEGATDYDVNYKPAVGGRWTNEPHRGIRLYNTIHDLEPGTEYRWAVRAENGDGSSEWVFGANFTTLEDETDETTEEEGDDGQAPAAPTNLRFEAVTDSSCTVRWDAAAGATDYDVNYKPAVGGRWTNEPHRGIGLSNTIDDLQPNTEYRWAVRAENSDGTSEWIHGPNFTTLPEGPDLIVQSPSVSVAMLTPEQAFTLQVTVHNQGDEQAAATMLHYYRSNNSTITASDTEVGTDAIDALDASATSAASIALTAPTGISPEVGIYYGACVASVSGESNTDNNCSSAVRVTVSGQETSEEADEPDLAAWLAEHPLVSEAIRWKDSNGPTRAYPNWSETQKADLHETYRAVWSGQSLELTDPPPNMRHFADDQSVVTVLSKDHAWQLFLAHVAYSLAVETGRWVPWSLTEHSREELLELFDGSRTFRRTSGGYELIHRAVPAPPDATFEFLSANLMIAQDRLHTIGNLLEWSRNLIHFLGDWRAKNVEGHWQYRGEAPVSRVISGTTPIFYPYKKGDTSPPKELTFGHYTAGCWGTTAFLRAVLRVVNIPVKAVTSDGHSMPYFMSEGKYLSHGDDPYGQNVRSSPGFPIEELFIDQATYDAWFGPGVSLPPGKSNVSRRVSDLTIKYLPRILLAQRCRDLREGRSGSKSLVWSWAGFPNYSVEELEAMNLWDRIDAKIDELGGCPIENSWVVFEPPILTIVKISGSITASESRLVVAVKDSEGQPIEGHLVTFTVTSGGGTLSVIRTTTDADGRAESRLTLGPDAGTNSVSVFAAGVEQPVIFTAAG